MSGAARRGGREHVQFRVSCMSAGLACSPRQPAGSRFISAHDSSAHARPHAPRPHRTVSTVPPIDPAPDLRAATTPHPTRTGTATRSCTATRRMRITFAITPWVKLSAVSASRVQLVSRPHIRPPDLSSPRLHATALTYSRKLWPKPSPRNTSSARPRPDCAGPTGRSDRARSRR